MKRIAFAIAVLAATAVGGAAYAGPGCSDARTHGKTAEAPPPPVPAPST